MSQHSGLNLLLDYSFEAGLGELFFEGTTDFVETLKIDPSRVVVLVSNHGVEARYNRFLQKNNMDVASSFRIIGEDLWLMYSGLEFSRKHWHDRGERIISQADVERRSGTLRPKKFLSLNRRPRWHRFLLSLMIEAAGLREQGVISMPSSAYKGDWASEDQYVDRFGSQMAPCVWEQLKQARAKVFPTLPWVIDIEMGKNSGQPEQFLFQTQARDLFWDTYVQVVTETAMDGEAEDVFITEKTCKSIANLQPFIVFGHANHLQRLSHHGFVRLEMFDDAYDAASAVGTRLSKLFAVLSQFGAWSNTDVHEMYHAELPRLRFNQNHLLEYPAVVADKVISRLREVLRA